MSRRRQGDSQAPPLTRLSLMDMCGGATGQALWPAQLAGRPGKTRLIRTKDGYTAPQATSPVAHKEGILLRITGGRPVWHRPPERQPQIGNRLSRVGAGQQAGRYCR